MPRFYAFDTLTANGKDLRRLPLIRRKLWLRSVVPVHGTRLFYCEHVEGDGEGLFRLASEHDLEGIVAKHRHGRCLPEAEPTWFKIRKEELFERERERNPDVGLWDSCVAACGVAPETHSKSRRAN